MTRGLGLDRERPFAFGKNWASYAAGIGDTEIAAAVAGLRRLLGGADLRGKRFLDIGCGAGIHGVAALKLGAADVLAVDVDPDSVSTSEAVLARYTPGGPYRVVRETVFALDPAVWGTFDVVYSWGVLHHTGDLRSALRRAAALVAPHGVLIVAIYRKTWLCRMWRWEKRWYARTSAERQAWARSVYVKLLRLLRADGGNYREFVASYGTNRGMDFFHDIHDWLGGYPYESISAKDLRRLMAGLGMRDMRAFVPTLPCFSIRQAVFARRALGLLGSGCDEYVFVQRVDHPVDRAGD